jgi:hypothetical protein
LVAAIGQGPTVAVVGFWADCSARIERILGEPLSAENPYSIVITGRRGLWQDRGYLQFSVGD